MDGYLQQVMVEYNASQDEILVYLVDHDPKRNLEAIIRVPLKLQDYVKLDNGSAYLGFCQETQNITNVCLIENWSFESSVKTS